MSAIQHNRRRRPRKRRSSTPKIVCFVLVGALGVGLLAGGIVATVSWINGRSESKDDSTSKNDGNEQNQNSTRHPMEKHLIGKWRGSVQIDEQGLTNRLRELGATQQRIDEVLRKQKSLFVEVSFLKDGRCFTRMTMGQEVILPGVEPETWKVIKSSHDELIVQNSKGSESDRWKAEFQDKDNVFMKSISGAKSITGYRLMRVMPDP